MALCRNGLQLPFQVHACEQKNGWKKPSIQVPGRGLSIFLFPVCGRTAKDVILFFVGFNIADQVKDPVSVLEKFRAYALGAPVLERSRRKGQFPGGLSGRQTFIWAYMGFISVDAFKTLSHLTAPQRCRTGQFAGQCQWAEPCRS